MSAELWHVKEHTIPASHPRGFPRGVRDEETSRLRLCLKQYVPKSNPRPQPGDVTLLLAHGVGSTKESYEPLFNELLLCTRHTPLRIRAVWAPDIAWHGASFRLNNAVIGDSPHWDDSARDLLQLITHFQHAMPLPIVAIGQSWGCYTILRAALMHPRAFTALVPIEPVIGSGFRDFGDHRNHRAAMMAKRTDRWTSRDAARKALLRNPYFARFDPRVFEKVMEFDLVDVDADGGGVELTTPKAMEFATIAKEQPEGQEVTQEERIVPGFYRPEAKFLWIRLQDMKSPCLYVWGTESDIALMKGYRDLFASQTGAGVLGNGGMAKGKVEEVWVEGVTHPIPLEKPKEAAEAIAPWLLKVVEQWKIEERKEKARGGGEFWVNKINPQSMEKIYKL